MTDLTAVIIDDEVKQRRLLGRMLSKFCKNVSVVGEAGNISTAVKIIEETSPDAVFLDIKLKNEMGFDLLAELPEIKFHTIFTTAHDSYAIKAIKWSALDYLLKPIAPEELMAAINKVQRLNIKENKDVINNNTSEPQSKIGLPTVNGLLFESINKIIRCEAKGPYTEFSFTDNKKVLISRSIKFYEELLSKHNFFRVHKSHLINMDHITEYLKGTGGNIIMTDGAVIAIAVRKKEDFLKRLLH